MQAQQEDRGYILIERDGGVVIEYVAGFTKGMTQQQAMRAKDKINEAVMQLQLSDGELGIISTALSMMEQHLDKIAALSAITLSQLKGNLEDEELDSFGKSLTDFTKTTRVDLLALRAKLAQHLARVGF